MIEIIYTMHRKNERYNKNIRFICCNNKTEFEVIKLAETQKRDYFLLHVIITFLMMVIIGNLPTFGEVTPVGMKMLGIFVAVVYAWSTTSMIWPSMLGILALAVLGIIPMTELFPLCFADQTIWFMTFVCIFVAVIEKAGIINYIANWMLSRKFIFGRPWLFTFFFLFAAWLCATLISELPAMFMFWSSFYAVAKKIELDLKGRYSFFMIFGIAFMTLAVANNVLPFKLGVLFFLGTYSSLTGISVDFGQYILFSIPISVLEVVFYVLMMRFVFKPDVSALKSIDSSFIDKSNLKIDLKLKIAFFYLIIMMILLLIPDFLPDESVIVQIINNIGKPGVMLGILISMFIVRVDKEPLLNFSEASKSIPWEIFFMMAFVMPFGNLLVSDEAGIVPTITGFVAPILQGLNPLLFILVFLFTSTLLSNVLNNAVVYIVYVGILASIASTMNIESIPIIVVLMFTIQLAFMTPAGSAAAALIFGNKWVNAKDMYKYSTIIVLLNFGFYFLVGLPIAYLVF